MTSLSHRAPHWSEEVLNGFSSTHIFFYHWYWSVVACGKFPLEKKQKPIKLSILFFQSISKKFFLNQFLCLDISSNQYFIVQDTFLTINYVVKNYTFKLHFLNIYLSLHWIFGNLVVPLDFSKSFRVALGAEWLPCLALACLSIYLKHPSC